MRVGALLAVSITLAACAGTSQRNQPGTPGSPPPSALETTPAPSSSPADSPVAAAAFPPLTLDSIFAPLATRGGPAWKGGAPAAAANAHLVTLVVTGDVIPARHVNLEMVRRNDFLWPFREVHDTLLSSGDIRLIDLEAPLLPGCPPSDSGFKFCGDPRFMDALAFAHVDVASLANNHLTNYGPEGTQDTVKYLADHGIQPCGLGLVARMTVKGVRFAFLGFNGVGVAVNRAEMKREIDLARPDADVVVVEFHWGKEYVLTPQSTHDVIAPDDPREIGHLAIDDGADLVIGNHPHAVQGVELYRGKLITYAHGNFVFDQMWTPDPGQEDPRNGVVGRYRFWDGKLVDVDYLPIRIYDYGQPRFLETAAASSPPEATQEGEAILERMRLSSRMIAGS
ncbi:MAG: CapA family protein [Candidatus Dormibacteria bacterium]